MQTIKTTGIIDNNNIIKINKTISKQFINKSVQILIIIQDDNEQTDEIDEQLWLKSITENLAFEFLSEQEEDIYSLTDGKPFEYEI